MIYDMFEICSMSFKPCFSCTLHIRNCCLSHPLLSNVVALDSTFEETGMVEGSVLVIRAGADVSIGELLFRRSSIEGTAPDDILLEGKLNIFLKSSQNFNYIGFKFNRA